MKRLSLFQRWLYVDRILEGRRKLQEKLKPWLERISKSIADRRWLHRFIPFIEPLESRAMMTVSVVPDAFTLYEDESVSGYLLQNDSGVTKVTAINSTPISGANTTLTLPSGANLTINEDGDFLYTPAGNVNGADTFTYTAANANQTENGTASANFTITAVNDASVVTTSVSTRTFSIGGSAVALDGNLTLADVDSANMTGATVAISSNFASGQDALNFTNQNGISGSYANGTLTLSGSATLANYQTALRSVTYSNANASTSLLPRTINFQVNDGGAENPLSNLANLTLHVNAPPSLSQVANQNFSYASANSTVTLAATDPNGDSLSYNVTLDSIGHYLRTTYSLVVFNTYYNYGGQQDRWFQASNGTWYFILPSGGFYQWNGVTNQATGTKLITVDRIYHTEPGRIQNESQGNGSIGVSVSGDQLTFNNSNAFRGEFFATATVSDGLLSHSRTFLLNLTNLPPDFSAVGNQTMPPSQDTLNVTLSATDAESENLTYSATVKSQVQLLDTQYAFATVETSSNNYGRLGEKWISSGSGGDKIWYYILPNGDLYRWDGAPHVAQGTFLANVGVNVYADPSRLVTPATAANVSLSGNNLTIDPIPSFNGTLSVTAYVADTSGNNVTQTFAVTVAPPPILTQPSNATVHAGSATNITLSASDSSNLSITYGVSSEAVLLKTTYGLSLHADGLYYNYYGLQEKWLVGAGSQIWYYITPDGGFWRRNSANTTTTFVRTVDTRYYDDPSLLYNAVSHANLTISGNILTVTPVSTFTGDLMLTVAANNGVFQDAKTFRITVLPPNVPPSFTSGGNVSTNEDTPYASTWAGNVSTGPSGENQTPNFTLTTSNNALFSVLPTINAAGNLTFTPASNAHGQANVTVALSDGVDTVSANFTITVHSVNDAPVLTAPATQATNEDTSLVFSGNSAISVADVDVASGNLTVNLNVTHGTLTLSGIGGLAFANGTGSGDTTMTFNGSLASINAALMNMTYAPTANYHGNATLQISVNDQGGSGSGGALGDNRTLSIAVNSVNDAPVAVDDPGSLAIETAEDTALSFNSTLYVLANDSDIDGDSLTITAYDATTAGGGTVYLHGNGTFTYTPAGNFHGTDSFTYTISDGHGGTDAATILVSVSSVNDAPIHAAPASASVNEDGSLVFSASNNNSISINDVDVGNGTVQVSLNATHGLLTLGGVTGLTFSSGDGTADANMTFNGTLASVNTALNGLIFSPAANYYGNATLQISTSDQGNSGSGSALGDSDTINLTITAVNDAPVAQDDLPTLTPDLSAWWLLTDGTGATAQDASNYDLDGTLHGPSWDSDVPPALASLSNSTLSFDGTNDYVGVANLDQPVLTVTAWVKRGNLNANQVLMGSADEGGWILYLDDASDRHHIHFGKRGTTVDAVGSTGTIDDTDWHHVAVAYDGSEVRFYVDGVLDSVEEWSQTFDSDAGDYYLGTVALDYFFAGAMADVRIYSTILSDAAIAGIADGNRPIAASLTTSKNVSITFSAADLVLANDSDIEGNSLSIGSYNSTTTGGGSISLSNGTFTYTPATDFSGLDSFDYVASDGQGGTDSATLFIRVHFENTAPTLISSSNLTTISEDISAAPWESGGNVGVTVESLMSADDVESGTALGIAVIGLMGSHGAWQYSNDPWYSSWVNLGSVSNSSATVLGPGTYVRFQPDGSAGTSASLSFRAWDQSNGLASGTTGVNATLNGGNSSFSATTATSALTVTNVNDAPILTQASNLPIITEDNTSSSGVLVSSLITASDADPGASIGIAITQTSIGGQTGDGDGQWQYKLSANGTWTDFEVSTGALLLAATAYVRFVPDTLNGTTGSLQIRAWDQTDENASGDWIDQYTSGGTAPLSSAVKTANITVSDAYDAPQMSNQSFSVNENSPGGTVVGTVVASDIDFGDSLAFTITGGTGSGVFALSSSGNLTVQSGANLDFEVTTSYTLNVQVMDGGSLTATCVVTVSINNVNEAPVLTDATVIVNEDLDIDGLVHQVTGYDPEGTPLSYSFDSNNDPLIDDVFQISISGEISLRQCLNTPGLPDSYVIHVLGTDAGAPPQTGTAVITVYVNHIPTDIDLSAESIPENFAVGTTVATLTTTDVDIAADLWETSYTYSLVSGTGSEDNGQFTIEDDQLKTAAVFNFESNGSYSIRIKVLDDHGLSYEKAFTISVDDVNDAPAIEEQEFSVHENAENGTLLGTVVAEDDDDGQSLTYSIAEGTPFSIDSETGALTLTGAVNPALDSYTFEVTAADDADPSLSSSVDITVNIIHPPEVDLSASTVHENRPSGTIVGTLSTEANATLTYSLVSGPGDDDNASFALSGNTLKTAAVFDFETESSYSIRVRALDTEGMPGYHVFNITVNDRNDIPVLEDVHNLPDLSQEISSASNEGVLVSSLFEGTDQDAYTQLGIAVTRLSGTHGVWQFSTTPGTWTDFGAISVRSATLLAPGDRIRFQPDGTGATFASISFRLWDQSNNLLSGATGIDVSNPGLDSPYSLVQRTAQLTVTDLSATTNYDMVFAYEDTPFVIDVLSNDTDPESDVLQITGWREANNGTVTRNANNTFTYTPNPNFNGVDVFYYAVTDGTSNSNTTEVQVVVYAVNDRPTFRAGLNQTVLENAGAQSTEGWATALLAGPADESAQNLTFEVTDNSNPDLFAVAPSIDSSGMLTYTPAADAYGTANITIRLVDDGGTDNGGVNQSISQLFSITVNGRPRAFDNAYATDEGSAVSGNFVVGNALGETKDFDPENGPMAVVSITTAENVTHALSNGSVQISLASGASLRVLANGFYVYDPQNAWQSLAANSSASDSFSYTIRDDRGQLGNATVTFNIAGLNDAPVAGNDTYTLDQNGNLTISEAAGVLVNDSDVDAGSTLTATVSAGPAHGTLALESNGSFTYTPNAGFWGIDSFTYVANDSIADSEAATVTLTIEPAPFATGNFYTLWQNGAANGNLITDSSPLGADFDVVSGTENLVATIVSEPEHGEVTIAANGSFEYVPDARYAGWDSFTYKVSNGEKDSQPATVLLQVWNTAPVVQVQSISVQQHQASSPIDLLLIGSFGEAYDAEASELEVTYVSAANHGNLTMNVNGTYTYTPEDRFVGVDSFDFTVSDGAASVTRTVLVTVTNTRPTASGATHNIFHDTIFDTSETSASDQLSFGDPDSVDTLTLTYSNPQHGSLTVDSNGEFIYEPDAGFVGQDTFTFTVDDQAGTVTRTIVINVTNSAPAIGSAVYSLQHDQTLTVSDTETNPDLRGLLYGVTDADGDYVYVSSYALPSSGNLTMTADGYGHYTGEFTFTPDAGFTGIVSFNYTISDGAVTLDRTAVIQVTNTPPVTNVAILEVAPETLFEGNLISDGLANELDASDTLSFEILDEPLNGTFSFSTTTGAFSYLPDTGFSSSLFAYSANDGAQSIVGVVFFFADTDAYYPLSVESPSFFVTHDQTLESEYGLVSTVEIDPELTNLAAQRGHPANASLYYGPYHGTLDSLEGDGSFEYTPDPGFTGIDTFSYWVITEATDLSAGIGLRVDATVFVTNTPPVLVDDYYSVIQGYTLEVDSSPFAGVLANDADADSMDTLSLIAISRDTSHGNLTMYLDGNGSMTGEFLYTPDAGFVGQDSFSYVVTDGATPVLATVVIDVTNTPPDIWDDELSAVHQGAVLSLAPALLTNDADGADGNTLTIASHTQTSRGDVTLPLEEPGVYEDSVTYTPDAGFAGPDSFVYEVHDGATSVVANVWIHVANEAPTALDDTDIFVVHNQSIIIDALANDSDMDSDALSIVSVGAPAHGNVTLNANNTLTYVPDSGYVGPDSFAYTITDGVVSYSANVWITVANTAPDAGPDEASGTAGEAIVISVLANDSDSDGDAIAIVHIPYFFGAGGPQYGTVEFDASDPTQIIYTANLSIAPTGDFDDTFTYYLSDGHGGFTSNSVTVHNTASASPPPPAVQFSSATYSANEEDGTATITVELSAANTQTVTVNYRAYAGGSEGDAQETSDFTAIEDGVLTFEAGQTTASFTVALTDDFVQENDEIVYLQILNASNASLGSPEYAQLTIAESDTAYTGFHRANDPGQVQLVSIGEATVDLNMGGLRLTHDLDFDLNPGNSVGGSPQLYYNSATVSPRPIVKLNLQTDAGEEMAPVVQVRLVFGDQAPQDWQYVALSNYVPGETYTIALQSDTPVAESGLYDWRIDVLMESQDGVFTQGSASGTIGVVVRTDSPLGAGWGISSIDQLIPVEDVGVLWIYGSGDSQFFALDSEGQFVSPGENFGNLNGTFGTGFTYTSKDQNVWQFNAAGQLTSWTDTHGLAITYGYDSSGRLNAVSSPDGGNTSIGYANGTVTFDQPHTSGNSTLTLAGSGITDADGATRAFTANNGLITRDSWAPYNTSFSYSAGLLTTVDQGLGSTYQIISAASRGLLLDPALPAADEDLATVTDGLGNTTLYRLDLLGRATFKQSPAGASQHWLRDATTGQVTEYTDTLNWTTVYEYDAFGDLRQIDTPDGGVSTFEYHPVFHKLTHASTYPAAGRLDLTVNVYDESNGDLLSQSVNGANTTYTWNNGLLETVTDPENNNTTYGYDAHRRWTSTVVSSGNITARAENYTYDGFGNYNQTLTVTGIADSDYSSTGRLLAQRYLQSNGTVIQSTTYAYFAAGQTQAVTDGQNNNTTYAYDTAGRLTREEVRSANGTLAAETTYAYDAAGNVDSVTDGEDNTSSFDHNPDGYVTDYATQNAADDIAEEAQWNLDANGNPLFERDGEGHYIYNAYNTHGQLESREIYDITGVFLSEETWHYDPAGRLELHIDPNGANTTYEYDAHGHLLSENGPLSSRAWNYNTTTGDLINYTDGEGNYTEYTGDASGRVTHKKVSDANTTILSEESWLYDGNGNQIAYTDPRNNVSNTTYDAAGNVVREELRENGTVVRQDIFTFDTAGNRITHSNLEGNASSWTFDAAGRTATSVDPNDNTTAYQYDLAGRLIRQSLHNGTISGAVVSDEQWSYDALNKRIGQVDSVANSDAWVYNQAGYLIRYTDPSGAVTVYAYDAAGRVTREAFYKLPELISANLVFEELWTYDDRGQMTIHTRRDGSTESWKYDARGNVIAYTDPLGNTTESDFDDNGNLIHQELWDAANRLLRATEFAYNADNQQTGAADPENETSTGEFDDNGNLLFVIDVDGNKTVYEYDAKHRVVYEAHFTIDDFYATPLTEEYWTYDDAGLLTFHQNPEGDTETWQYNAAHQLTFHTNLRGDVTECRYDDAGRKTHYIQYTGAASPSNILSQETWTYDDAGNLLSHTDPRNNTESWTYDPAHRVKTYTDPKGNVTYHEYDGNGRLTLKLIYDADDLVIPAHTESWDYDDANRTVTHTDPSDNTRTWINNAAGQLAQYTDSAGNVTAYEYDAAGRLVVQIFYDAADLVFPASTEHWQCDDAGNLIAHTDANANTESWTYDGARRVTTHTDFQGNFTTYLYDRNDRVIHQERWDAAGYLVQSDDWAYDTRGNVVYHADIDGNEKFWEYDNLGRVKEYTDPAGNTTAYEYDNNGRLLEQELRNALDELIRSESFGYDPLGNQNSYTNPLGHTTTSQFDAAGRLIESVDNKGNKSISQYFADGTLEFQELRDSSNALIRKDSWTYDDRGNMESHTQLLDATGTPVYRTESWEYDWANRVDRFTDFDGRVTDDTWNDMGQLIERKIYASLGGTLLSTETWHYDDNGNVDLRTDIDGNEFEYVYFANRLVEQTVRDAADNIVDHETWDHDDAGNVILHIDHDDRATVFAYNDNHQLIERTVTDTTGTFVETWEYDGAGNMIRHVDALGRASQFDYNGAGQLVWQRLAAGTSMQADTHYAYDDNGNMLSLTDPNDNTTSFTFDAHGNKLSALDPFGEEATFEYDELGRLETSTDRLGRRREFEYADTGYTQTEKWYDDADTLVETITITFDVAGNILTATNSAGTYTHHYDAAGQLLSVDQPTDVTLEFEYDARGNRTRIEDPFANVTTSTYDSYNRLVRREQSLDGATLRIDQTYDWSGRLATQTRYTDGDLTATTTYTYDGKGRLIAKLEKDPNDITLAAYTWTFHAADQLIAQTDHGVTTTYSYDTQGQLTDDGTTEILYDAAGNRDSVNSVSQTVGDGNRLESDGYWTYSYDLEGNLTEKEKIATTEKWTYGYDHRNQLIHAEHTTDGTAVDLETDYTYDAFANRIQKTVDADGAGSSPAVTTKSALDGWNPAKPAPIGNENWDVYADLTAASALETQYLRGDVVDQIFAHVTDDTPIWLLTDHLGSIRDLVNGNGTSAGTIEYDAWGNITADDPDRGRYAWTARELDVETELQYNRARYYDATTGRWISQDPLGFDAGDSNLYRYVSNQPSQLIDASGFLPPDADPAWSRKQFERDQDELWEAEATLQSTVLPNGKNALNYRPILRSRTIDLAIQIRNRVPYVAVGPYIGTIRTFKSQNSEYEWTRREDYLPQKNALKAPAPLRAVEKHEAMQDLALAAEAMSFGTASPVPMLTRWLFEDAIDIHEQQLFEELGVKFERPGAIWKWIGRLTEVGVTVGINRLGRALASGGHGPQGGPTTAPGVAGNPTPSTVAITSSQARIAAATGESIESGVTIVSRRGAPDNQVLQIARPKIPLQTVAADACFVAGTPLLTPSGDKPIQLFQVGDEILSRPESDCEAPIEVRQIEQIFVRLAPIVALKCRGLEIHTTAEHPFFIKDKGWLPVKEIQAGDQLLSHDGQWVAVEAVTDLNEVATVYNLRVSDYHTYFVGSREWGFSVWAHNTCHEIFFDTASNAWRIGARENGVIRAVNDVRFPNPQAARAWAREPGRGIAIFDGPGVGVNGGIPTVQGNAHWGTPTVASEIHPGLPAYTSGPTRGVLEGVGYNPTQLISGTSGPGQQLGNSLTNLSTAARDALTHTEGHAAALLRASGAEQATLTINYYRPELSRVGPCGICTDGVSELLLPGQRLYVRFQRAGGQGRGNVGIGYFQGGVPGFTLVPG